MPLTTEVPEKGKLKMNLQRDRKKPMPKGKHACYEKKLGLCPDIRVESDRGDWGDLAQGTGSPGPTTGKTGLKDKTAPTKSSTSKVKAFSDPSKKDFPRGRPTNQRKLSKKNGRQKCCN